MGLMQKACETYDFHESIVGVYRAGHEPLVPIGHSITQAKIEITINIDGKFISARNVNKEKQGIIFPVTPESNGRTSTTIRPHPLCDKLEYMMPEPPKNDEEKGNSQKFDAYVKQLSQWVNSPYSHPIISAVFKYVEGGSLSSDLASHAIRCKPNDMVCWRVIGVSGEEACWKNKELFDLYNKYYASTQVHSPKAYCMISGKKDYIAQVHAKKLLPFAPNAKIISSNDLDGFTFRGRFQNSYQAVSIGYETSQKAHNTLTWIIAEQKASYTDKAAFLCWSPKGINIPSTTDPFGCEVDDSPNDPYEYKRMLNHILKGYKTEIPDDDNIIIASVEATQKSTGRLSITYYNELLASDFLARLYSWDERCSWFDRNGSEFVIRSPSLYKIISCAYGRVHESKDSKATWLVDQKIIPKEMTRLITCRVEKKHFPVDLKNRLVQRVSSLQNFPMKIRPELLHVTCSILRKYYFDQKGEDWSMALEPTKQDLSYQYGRLLAVFEKAERDTYSKDETNRETNAIRMLVLFCRRPKYATVRIHDQLKHAYFRRLKPGSRVFYEKLIGEILVQISECPGYEIERPLEDSYLMGYYLQSMELWKKNKKQEEYKNVSIEEN